MPNKSALRQYLDKKGTGAAGDLADKVGASRTHIIKAASGQKTLSLPRAVAGADVTRIPRRALLLSPPLLTAEAKKPAKSARRGR